MQKKTRKQYSAEFKAKVVKEMLREEKTVGQLASEYGVHSTMLYSWLLMIEARVLLTLLSFAVNVITINQG